MVTRGCRCRIQDCHLLWLTFPGHSASEAFVTALGSHNPGPKTGLGYVRVRSPLLTESRLISFPPGTEMSQFPGLARPGLCIQPGVTPSSCEVTSGFPIRTSPDQSSLDNSPGHIAAYHVLHRLSTPRHPPCTLRNLIACMTGCPPAITRRCRRRDQDTFDAMCRVKTRTRSNLSSLEELKPVVQISTTCTSARRPPAADAAR